MSSEEHHVALPKLHGAPAYARPPRLVEMQERPLDPDDLPLEVLRTPEEQELVSQLSEGSNGGDSTHRNGGPTDSNGNLKPRPFSLSAIAGRFFGN